MDSTTDDNQSQDTYPNTGRDSGYVAPVGEDLVNRLTILISGLETKLLLQGQETQRRIKALDDDGERRQDYLLGQVSQFTKDLDNRLAGHVKALTATVLEAVAASGKAIALAETVAAGQAELAGIVSDQGERIDKLSDRVTIVEQTPGTYPDLLQGMHHLEQTVTEISRRSDRRQLYLLIAIGSIILLFVVLVALQIASS